MSTYTTSLGLERITPGDQAGLWGNTTNNNLNLIDQAITGVTPISFAGLSGQTYTLTDFDGAVDEARSAVINITGIATGSNTIIVPNKQKTYLVRNATGQNVIFRTATPGATYTVEAGNSILIFTDANNNVFTGIASPSVGTLGVAGGGTGATTFGVGGFIKSAGGTNALIASPTVSLTTEVSGTLPVANGGTGGASFTSGSLLIGGGVGVFGTLVGTVNGQVATWNSTLNSWTAATPATGVASFSGGTTGLTPATATTGVITLGGTLEITNGGTGATTQSGARTNLGLGNVAQLTYPGNTSTFLRGDGNFASLPSSVTSITGGTGITVTGSTTPTISLSSLLTPGNYTNASVSVNAQGVITAVSSGSGGSTGTVTSVGLSGGTTGLTVSGTNPITTSGTFTLAGTLAIANGGTGATSFAAAGLLTTSAAALTYAALSGNQTLTGTNTYSTTGAIIMNGSSVGDQRLQINGSGMSSGMSPSGLQAGASGWGLIYSTTPELSMVTGGPFTTAFRQTGNFQSNNSPNWATTSDINIKTNLRPINDALGKLCALQPKHFEYKDELGKVRSGFIAQEFETVFPGHTTETVVSEKYKEFMPEGVDTLKALDLNLVPYLVKAIQELKTELDAAKAEIEALKAQ